MNSSIYGITQREVVLTALVVATYKNDDLSMADANTLILLTTKKLQTLLYRSGLQFHYLLHCL